MRTIVVTGATGTVGRAVVELLDGKPDVTVRATTRHPDSLRAVLQSERITPVAFDWDAPKVIDDIVTGADTMLLLPPAAHHPLPTAALLAEGAVRAGVRHVVFLSTLGADFVPGFTFGRWALTGERAVAAAGVPYTVLRPNSFMTNFVSGLRPGEDGALRLPWGSGATSFVDPRDVASAAARILLDPDDHVGTTYELTGPEALGADALAAAMSQASGAPIHYVETPAAIVRAALSKLGMPAPMVTAFLDLHAVMASGARAPTTGDVERVTERPPRSFAEFATDHAAAWTRPKLTGLASGRSSTT
jgi:uncharacterized protein YbjT (DUF2867 family)